ncbi:MULTISPECIES: flagellar basal body rod protein FlgF [Novosphingobium]|uniref:Flagellar basal-body rod protein FlgF n=1 Tax=Novosphingobium mathurense TaxID=428990 RepID=A0A1U6HI15_9SPHN|nr:MULTISPECIES: flagellar basal body rod protein FlgF [Novosphingobium]CDO35584.1 Flagellar basal-body rod FlgF [Novosphingobium sp. KN65.2]SLJ95413.1 flagellar basal-body rod protein FlgF [Novosphingobium mathurense]
MDRLIYTAVSGMNASMTRERVIASNMANAQTIGFRKEIIQATPMTLEGPQLEARAMTSTEVRGASMKEGAVTSTGNPLDVALDGDAMLAVQAYDGGEAYTRRGDLSVSVTGVIENGEGLPVLGDNGPVTVPPGSIVTIAPDGGVLVKDPATPEAPPVRLDRLKLVSTTGSKIEKDLAGQFRVSGGGALPVDENARLTPQALEQSNVNASEVLVEMISAQRLFEMRTKLIETAKQLDEGGARLMRIES